MNLAACIITLGAAFTLGACQQVHEDAQAAVNQANRQQIETANVIDAAVQEVLQNIRSQAVGQHTVGDYHLPENFLRSLADRIILESFESRFRIVVDDAEADKRSNMSERLVPQREAPAAAKPGDARIIRRHVPPVVQDYRSSLREMRPPLRGFRAAVLDRAHEQPPIEPADAASDHLRRAAEIVAKRLSLDGLLLTTAKAITAMGPEELVRNPSDSTRALQSIGLPIDWLRYFHHPQFPQPESSPAESIVQWMAAQLHGGANAEDLAAGLGNAQFKFKQSVPDFRVLAESGEDHIAALRVQLTRGDEYLGPGDGSNIDMLRHLHAALPDVDMIASVQNDYAAQFIRTVQTWNEFRLRQFTLICEDQTVSQWAQDNVKAGYLDAEAGGIVLLMPRFASRGEDGSIFVPGETFAAEGLAAAGFKVVQSPLLFQGGNLLAVQHPQTRERILLVGEAEIHRNTVLGLTPSQVKEAFRIEFGVDRCEVLPAVSFHIDYDVSLRAHDGRLIAFVNDTDAAIPIVLRAAIKVMVEQDLLDESLGDRAHVQLADGQWNALLQTLGPHLYRHADEHGHFPLRFASRFSTSEVDSGVGNLHRILFAMDMLAATVMADAESTQNRALAIYLDALRRRAEARQRLHQHLKQLGFELVPVPSLADAARSINTINGIHARGIYLMPAYGGLFAELDRAAAAVYQRRLGPAIRVIAIPSGESQRRVGALHCSCAVLYKSNGLVPTPLHPQRQN